MAIVHFNILITYIKYESGKKIILSVVRKTMHQKRWHIQYYFEVPQRQMLLLLSYWHYHYYYNDIAMIISMMLYQIIA